MISRNVKMEIQSALSLSVLFRLGELTAVYGCVFLLRIPTSYLANTYIVKTITGPTMYT